MNVLIVDDHPMMLEYLSGAVARVGTVLMTLVLRTRNSYEFGKT